MIFLLRLRVSDPILMCFFLRHITYVPWKISNDKAIRVYKIQAVQDHQQEGKKIGWGIGMLARGSDINLAGQSSWTVLLTQEKETDLKTGRSEKMAGSVIHAPQLLPHESFKFPAEFIRNDELFVLSTFSNQNNWFYFDGEQRKNASFIPLLPGTKRIKNLNQIDWPRKLIYTYDSLFSYYSLRVISPG